MYDTEYESKEIKIKIKINQPTIILTYIVSISIDYLIILINKV